MDSITDADLDGAGRHDVLRKTVNTFGRRGGRRKLGRSMQTAAMVMDTFDPRLAALSGRLDDVGTVLTGEGITMAGAGVSLAGAGLGKTLRGAIGAVTNKDTRHAMGHAMQLGSLPAGMIDPSYGAAMGAAGTLLAGSGKKKKKGISFGSLKALATKDNTAALAGMATGLAALSGNQTAIDTANKFAAAERFVQNDLSNALGGAGHVVRNTLTNPTPQLLSGTRVDGAGLHLAGHTGLRGDGINFTKALNRAKKAASRKNTAALANTAVALADLSGNKTASDTARKLAAAEAIIQGQGLATRKRGSVKAGDLLRQAVNKRRGAIR
ncbi:MAG: hypothetical protein AAFS07_19180, partial [Pseudomonadota bacterium]